MDNGFSPWGGYMDAKITKLEEQFTAASSPFRQTNLFDGISIYVNGLTNPSADELKRIMMVHGGVYHHYERKNTKFIIASCLPDVKIRNMNTSKLISAQWIVDCLKEQKIIDYTKYLLYTNHKPSQPKILFQKKDKIEPEKDVFTDLEILNNKIKMSTSVTEKSIENITKNLNEIKRTEDTKISNNSILNLKSNAAARTAVDPKFLTEFYNNSRLHHIATLGSGFKQYVSELREKNVQEIFPARALLKDKSTKKKIFKNISETIMHIDMDCFFVSVGLRTHKHLIGQPIAVTHSKGGTQTVHREGVDRQLEMDLYMKRLETKLHDNIKSDKVKNGFEGKESLSEIASCSYEARKMGVRNGMFVGQALKLCPQLKTIPYDFEGYKEVAFSLYNTIAQYTLNIEAVSCDEMFVNLTDLLNDVQLEPMKFVSFIREEIQNKTNCPCSAGVGRNKLLARMATKIAKPNGQFYLNPTLDAAVDCMSDILISDLPGVGQSTTYTLKQQNWLTCGDLQKVSLSKLQMELGKKFGETLYQFCRGIDKRPLVYGQIRKSVSAEVNYGIRFKEFSELEIFLKQICTEVHSRLTDIKRKGKCITLKVMIRAKDAPIESSKFMGHGYCDHLSKSVSLSDYTDNLEKINTTVLATMRALNIPPSELRGIGIQISKLDDPTEEKEKKENMIKNMFDKVIEIQKAKKIKDCSETPENMNSILKVPSPEKRILISPNKKNGIGRGRETNKTKISSEQNGTNIINMLQNAPVVRKRSPENNLDNLDIDMGVFAELPEDIQAEILEQQKTQSKKFKSNKISPKKSKRKMEVDPDFLTALPPELRLQVEKEIREQQNTFLRLNKSDRKEMSNKIEPSSNSNSPVKTETVTNKIISSENIFLLTEAPELIETWVQITHIPEECDVQILSEHFKEFVKARKIHILYIPAVRFHRSVLRQNCAWHSAYKSVISNLQKEMIVNYGARMLLDEELNCENCK